ncbi:helix-turn-helix transcriptional regulator [Candidatus Dojkabacteria bacterium]|nr:helix-turn-helix transcriptional regulator [Candidatus Dojkabacteria bacterium]
MNLKQIGLTIKHIRQTKGLTQKQLAEQIGTTWEMVSRYETGRSSPMGRIDAIALALEVPVHKILQSSIVEEETPRYNRNLVPHVKTLNTNLEEEINSTKSFYTAPDWIVQKFLHPFAIDAENLVFDTTQVEKSGLLFATLDKPKSERNLVITSDKSGNLSVTSTGNIKKNTKILATIIAWEKRFA